jgi:hypothetical protein
MRERLIERIALVSSIVVLPCLCNDHFPFTERVIGDIVCICTTDFVQIIAIIQRDCMTRSDIDDNGYLYFFDVRWSPTYIGTQ